MRYTFLGQQTGGIPYSQFFTRYIPFDRIGEYENFFLFGGEDTEGSPKFYGVRSGGDPTLVYNTMEEVMSEIDTIVAKETPVSTVTTPVSTPTASEQEEILVAEPSTITFVQAEKRAYVAPIVAPKPIVQQKPAVTRMPAFRPKPFVRPAVSPPIQEQAVEETEDINELPEGEEIPEEVFLEEYGGSGGYTDVSGLTDTLLSALAAMEEAGRSGLTPSQQEAIDLYWESPEGKTKIREAEKKWQEYQYGSQKERARQYEEQQRRSAQAAAEQKQHFTTVTAASFLPGWFGFGDYVAGLSAAQQKVFRKRVVTKRGKTKIFNWSKRAVMNYKRQHNKKYNRVMKRVALRKMQTGQVKKRGRQLRGFGEMSNYVRIGG